MFKRFSPEVLCFDCPECQAVSAVIMFVAMPEIWKCGDCCFLFERYELLKHQNKSCRSRKPEILSIPSVLKEASSIPVEAA